MQECVKDENLVCHICLSGSFEVSNLAGATFEKRGGGGGLASRIEFVAHNKSRVHIFGHS